MSKIEHKHASVLRAIADGVPLSEFEITTNGNWDDMADGTHWAGWIYRPERWEIRRKPQHIIVNGFKVPKPLEAVPDGDIYAPDFVHDDLFDCWKGPSMKSLATKRGCAHATAEAAIAHAKAMLGINPEE